MYYVENWKKLTSDQQVLQMMRGYKIPLKCIPHQWITERKKEISEEKTKLLKTAISELKLKRALEVVNQVKDQYLSTLFALSALQHLLLDSRALTELQ